MPQLTLDEMSHFQDRDTFFCRFHDERMREVKVIVTAATLSELKRYQCDLEMACRYAAEHVLSNGVEGDVEFVGSTYLAVKKRLRISTC